MSPFSAEEWKQILTMFHVSRAESSQVYVISRKYENNEVARFFKFILFFFKFIFDLNANDEI